MNRCSLLILVFLIIVSLITPIFADIGKELSSNEILNVQIETFVGEVPDTTSYLIGNENVVKTNPQDRESLVSIGKTQLKAKNWKGAEQTFEQALTVDSSKEDAWEGYLRAIVMQDNSETRLLQKAQEAIEKIPNSPVGFFWLGNALDRQGKEDEANQAYDQALRIDPEYDMVLITKARKLSDLGKDDEAIVIYDQIIVNNQNNADAWYNKGNALRNLNKYEESIKAYDQTTKIDPDYTNAWVNKGDTLVEIGKNEEAIEAYDQAIRGDPEDAIVWGSKGDALATLSKYEDAILAYAQVIRINSNDAEAWVDRATAKNNLNRYLEALSDIEVGISLDSSNAHAYYVKAYALVGLNRSDEARIVIQKAIALEPNTKLYFDYLSEIKRKPAPISDTLVQRAAEKTQKPIQSSEPFTYTPRLSFVVGITPGEKTKYETNLESLEKQLTEQPESKELRAEKGNTLRLLGRFIEAAALYEEILKNNPDYAPALTGIGTVVTEAYNPELNGTLPGYTRSEAIAAYEKSLKIDPENPITLTGLGYAYRMLAESDIENKKENIQKSLDLFNKSITIKPKSVEALIGRSMSWDNDPDSLFDLKQAITYNPDSVEANTLLGLFSADPSYVNTAISLQPDQTYPYIFHGLIRENNWDFPGAIESVKKAQEKYTHLSLFPGYYPEIYRLLAAFSLENGDEEAALPYMKEISTRLSERGAIS